MSLTSQIKDKNSPVRRFFAKFENKEGIKECLALLQSTKPVQPPILAGARWVVYAFAGTTTDYLIRYIANGNRLDFEEIIANQALKSTVFLPHLFARDALDDPKTLVKSYQDANQHLNNLYQIGKQYLDGRDAADHKAVYSATALAMMDNVFRSGFLPKVFYEPVTKTKKYG